MKLYVTLATVTPADAVFAAEVARVLKTRMAATVRIVAASASLSDAIDAIVSSAPAARLEADLDRVVMGDAVPAGDALRFPCLIHSRPDAAHYAYALRHGLRDVIAWPDEVDRWCAAFAVHSAALGGAVEANAAFGHLVGSSPAMAQLRQRITKLAGFDSNVLLVGETGVGKEEVVRAIHQASRRRSRPLICINCAALPEHLIESELFGYERGAFTGAINARPGKFAAAEGGTLFLDEIGELPPAAQAKILRAIENREYFPLGAAAPRSADVRLVAATHRDLDEMCERGEFRLDLYFRLNVARLDVPPLRERRGDIVFLAQHFLRELSAGEGHGRPRRFGAEALTALSRYHWPGNVRELRNAVETALINAEADVIMSRDLPMQMLRWLERAVPADERKLLESALRRTHWNKSEAARSLHWSRMKLYRKLEHYGIGIEEMAAGQEGAQPPAGGRGRRRPLS